MDPFNSIPAEIRVQILLHLGTKPRVGTLVQASPAMFQQYRNSTEFVTRTMLAADLDEDVIQDAMAIILFPSLRTCDDSAFILRQHMNLWQSQKFTNPLLKPNTPGLKALERLHRRLLTYIEDYLAKATHPFPPRAYRCLPNLASCQSQLIFRGRVVSGGFDANDLNVFERRRIFRAFLRYELIGKINQLLWVHKIPYLEALGRLEGWSGLYQHMRGHECESLGCVYDYVKSLYGAMFVQCNDHNGYPLPDPPAEDGAPSSNSRYLGLLQPDNMYFCTDSSYGDLGFNDEDEDGPRDYDFFDVAVFGFDLVTSLVASAVSGCKGRERLYKWIERASRVYPGDGRNLQVAGHSSLNPEIHKRHEVTGICEKLWSEFEGSTDLLHNIYRQRAWAFFDDARFYPGHDIRPHLPTTDEVEEEPPSSFNNKRAYRRYGVLNYHYEPHGEEDTENNRGTDIDGPPPRRLAALEEIEWLLPFWWYCPTSHLEEGRLEELDVDLVNLGAFDDVQTLSNLESGVFDADLEEAGVLPSRRRCGFSPQHTSPDISLPLYKGSFSLLVLDSIMSVVAVAEGLGQLGRAIVDALLGDGKYEVLTHAVTKSEINAPVIQVDYNDVDTLASILEAQRVQIVISSIVTLGGGAPGLNLIQAAEKSAATKRYVPSFWAHDYPDEFKEYFFAKPKYDAIEALDSTSLEYTAFRIGWFTDYYVAPHVKSYIRPEGLFVDTENNAAAIPRSGTAPAVFTHSLDNEFVQIAEDVKGVKFKVTYDSKSSLEAGEITELPAHRSLYEHKPKDQLRALLSIYGRDFAMGGFNFEPPLLVNDLFPSIKPKTVQELVEEAWGRKEAS
ncbi:hypothetical protein NM208_g5647 [Fusarium decemcellulare]|uniref:Uncharacterized protein n=1 Tax=Fusarium decemcellulare TaxID=57161 RepID=A0ACC1SG59_9HYPO|nr:hypothetical protein NM208_g5647 [Fusarium decemcellulare]